MDRQRYETDENRLGATLREATRTEAGSDNDPDATDFRGRARVAYQWQLAARRFRRHKLAMFGVAILGDDDPRRRLRADPLPYNPAITPPTKPGGDPPVRPNHIFGTTRENKDVFNLVVNGARISIIIGIARCSSPASWESSWAPSPASSAAGTDNVLMRIVDVLLRHTVPVHHPGRGTLLRPG